MTDPEIAPAPVGRLLAAHRLDRITDADRLREVAERLLEGLAAAQWQRRHLTEAFVGGCTPCSLAIDAGEHPAHACAAWNYRQVAVDDATRGL
jgi:hypothetical protein